MVKGNLFSAMKKEVSVLLATSDVDEDKSPIAVMETADKETWTEFADIINIAAYSSHDVTGHQLETVRLLSEKMRKEVFSSMPKVVAEGRRTIKW